ncbi:MAG TPA: pilus assembly protein PilM [Paenibacillaceae bacterium]
MFGKIRNKRRCGLQFLDRQVKLVAAAGPSGSRIVLFRAIPLAEGTIKEGKILDEEGLIHQLSDHVRQLSLAGAEVSLTIPTSSVILRKATFPRVREKELRNLIDVELHSGETQLPFRNPVFDFVTVRQGKEDQEVIIFASPMEVVEQYVRVVRNAGLQPVAVDTAPLALFRLLIRGLRAYGQTLPERFLLLDAENERADISIFVGGYPVFFRTVQMQSAFLPDEDEDRNAVYARQLSIELGRVMNYYRYNVASDQEDVRQLILVGDPSLCETLRQNMEEEFERILQMPVDGALTNFEPSHKSFAVPIGLAMKGA